VLAFLYKTIPETVPETDATTDLELPPDNDWIGIAAAATVLS